MHPLDLPNKSPPLDHVVIKLVPSCRGRQFGTREFGQRGEVEAIDETINGIEAREDCNGEEDGREHFSFLLFSFLFSSYFGVEGGKKASQEASRIVMYG